MRNKHTSCFYLHRKSNDVTKTTQKLSNSPFFVVATSLAFVFPLPIRVTMTSLPVPITASTAFASSISISVPIRTIQSIPLTPVSIPITIPVCPVTFFPVSVPSKN